MIAHQRAKLDKVYELQLDHLILRLNETFFFSKLLYGIQQMKNAEIMAEKNSKMCSICCNEQNKKFIVCNFCNNVNSDEIKIITCQNCVKKYLLEEQTEAKCMICKRQWHNSFLYQSFKKSFLHTDYRSHLKNLWIEREKSLIPSTIPYVKAHQQLNQLNQRVNDVRQEIETKEQQIKNLKQEIYLLENQKVDLKVFLGHIDESNSKVELDLLMPCSKENCKGLVEKSTGKCVSCDQEFCKICFDSVTNDQQEGKHECDKIKMLSGKEINHNTKPCPKCATRIYKIDGCDMMFCTNCKVSFSWSKGSLLNGPIHNPHYFDWIHQQSLQISQSTQNITQNFQYANCDEVPDYIQHFFEPFEIISKGESHRYQCFDVLRNIIRSVVHFKMVELIWYTRETTVNHELQMRNLRIYFVLDKISQDGFVKSILLSERKRQKLIIVRNVIESYVNATNDCLHNLSRYLIDTASNLQNISPTSNLVSQVLQKIADSVDQMIQIRTYANETLQNECSLLGFTSCLKIELNGFRNVHIPANKTATKRKLSTMDEPNE